MQTREHLSPLRAKKDFAEWASLFSGKIFVKIAAYVDESGRYDKTGQLTGAGQIVVSGWVDWVENWTTFCGQWQSILNKNDAPYFHFAEWAYASYILRSGKEPSSSFSKNPYRKWPLEKLDAFLYELAAVAGGGQKIFVGGFISTRDFSEAKKHPAFSRFAPASDPYQACLNQFFLSFSNEVQQQWQYWKEPVSFFFDKNDDAEWNHAILDAFGAAQKKDARIAELSFVNGKIPPHLPLQAADMICGRNRQLAANFTDPKILMNPSKLDDLLIKPSYLRATLAWKMSVRAEHFSMLSLRHGNYPWRNKNQP